MYKKLTYLCAVAVSALVLSACSDNGTGSDVPVVLAESAIGPEGANSTGILGAFNPDGADQNGVIGDLNGAAGGPAPMNIVETAVDAKIFTTLVAALEATGLDATLSDPNSTFTVFAPTDDAFNALGADTINALLGDLDTLSDILLYHVVPGAAVDAATAISLAGTTVTMANGDDVALVLSGGNLMVNNATVTVTDIVTTNGIIHVIDTVLIPPAGMTNPGISGAPHGMNIVETAVAAGNFNTLATALTVTGLIDTLSNTGDTFTVFAPTDAAFAALPAGELDRLIADPDRLRAVLLNHVIGGSAVDSVTAMSLAGQSVLTASGDTIDISVSGGNLMIDNATVTTADVMASNGIIHVIDSVLITLK